SHNAACSDESTGIERAGRDFAAGVCFAASGLGYGAIDHPAHDAAAEHGQRSSNREIGSNSERQRAYAENFHGDDHKDTKKDEPPWQFARQDAIDDSRHETALWFCGFLAADPLHPLDFDIASLRIVKILAIGKCRRSQRIEQHVWAAFHKLR